MSFLHGVPSLRISDEERLLEDLKHAPKRSYDPIDVSVQDMKFLNSEFEKVEVRSVFSYRFVIGSRRCRVQILPQTLLPSFFSSH